MMRGIVIWLVVCGLAAAMVSRDRRAVDIEEKEVSNNITICSRETPCAWSVYKPNSKIVEMNVRNTYCECGAGTECVNSEEDSNAIILRCRLPSEPSAWKQS